MGADGEVVVSARIATTQAEKDLVKFEKELEKFNEKGQKLLEQKAEIDTSSSVEEEEKKLIEYQNELETAKQKFKEFKRELEETKTVGTKWNALGDLEEAVNLASIKVEEQKQKVAEVNEEYQKTIPELEEIDKKIKDNARNQETVKRKIEETNAEINRNNLAQIKDQLNNIGNSTGGVIRKVTKWGLALVGIRSAYAMLSSSASMLSSQNEQIGADIQYIKWAIATTLQPVIEYIIQLAYKLLTYINYIANAWFGVNLFAKATAENFKKTKDGIKGANNEAKKLQKTLSGFDEMNILQENGGVSPGGGGGGITLPSSDLSQLGDIEIPGWVDWIAKNKDTIIQAIKEIGTAFLTWKLLELTTHMKLFSEGLSGWGKALQTVGIALIIYGIYNAINDVINLITNFSWNGVFQLISDLSVALLGLSVVLLTINASNPFGWIALAISGIGLLIGAIGGLITATDDEANSIENETWKMIDNKKALEDLENARLNVASATGKYTTAVKANEKANEQLKEAEDKTGLSGKELYEQFLKNKDIYETFNEKQRLVFDAYVKQQETEKNLKTTTEELAKAKDKETRQIEQVTRGLIMQEGAYDENFQTLIDGYRNGTFSSEEFADSVMRTMTFMDKESRRVFAENLPDDIRQSLLSMDYFKQKSDETKKMTGYDFQAILASAKSNFSEVGMAISGALDYNKYKTPANNIISLFNKINNAVKTVGTSGFNIKVSSSGFAKGGIVTKLATGGIVNRPGRGVPVASASMGEAGREGILPLTDAQAMETLGQAIGRYVNINANIPVYMGNRQIAREIRKIEAEDDFAFNS